MIKTFATMFSGGGGWDCGAIAAGLTPLWGIEYDEKIAGVYRANFGDHVIVDKVQNVDPARLARPDVLFMSPPCPNFSNAKVGAEETVMDIEMATACVKFITTLKPGVVFLENVRGYLNSKSFRMIRAALDNSGYWTDAQVVNSADFGVPQTRERLILRAHLGGLWSVPALPEPVKWVGWYEAIRDLIPTLPESKFADWQLKRLPEMYTNTLVASTSTDVATRLFDEPVTTIVSSIGTHSMPPRAFIMDSNSNNNQESITVRSGENPMFTLSASLKNQAGLRAFIVGQDSKCGVSDIDAPVFTITSNSNRTNIRACLSQGKVVQMTPRALARFQSFPDSYILPENKALACKVIGNAVPPKLAEVLVRQFVEMLNEQAA